MTAVKPSLHSIEPSSEAVLRALFDREVELLNELSIVVGAQKIARREYAAERGLLILPSMAKLREVLR